MILLFRRLPSHTAIIVASDRDSILARLAAGQARLHFYKKNVQTRMSIFLFYRAQCDITTHRMVRGGANDGSGLNSGEKRHRVRPKRAEAHCLWSYGAVNTARWKSISAKKEERKKNAGDSKFKYRCFLFIQPYSCTLETHVSPPAHFSTTFYAHVMGINGQSYIREQSRNQIVGCGMKLKHVYQQKHVAIGAQRCCRCCRLGVAVLGCRIF